jgi:hypothetical protein
LEWCCHKPHHRPNDPCWHAKDLVPGQLPWWTEAEIESSQNFSVSFGARPNSLVVLPLDLEMVVRQVLWYLLLFLLSLPLISFHREEMERREVGLRSVSI